MATGSKRPKGREGTLSLLDAAIEAVDFAEEIATIAPIKAAFRTVKALLTMIKVCFLRFYDKIFQVHGGQESMVNELDYVELGLFCADICRALDQGMNGKQLDDLSHPVRDAINRLRT